MPDRGISSLLNGILGRIIAKVTGPGFLTFGGSITADRIHAIQDIAGTIPLIEVQPCASFQNKLINPRFYIWQRGTSFAAVASGAYTADRWFQNFDGSGVATISRQAHTLGAIPTEPEYFLRYQVTSAGAGGTGRNLIQAIESVRTLAGKRVQVTFWAKADAARTVALNLTQNFGSGGAPSGAVFNVGTSANLTTSWQQYTTTMTVASISGKTVGTIGDDSLSLTLQLPINTLMTLDFSEVEVKEVAASGQVNSPMEIRPLQVELALCQRYYEIGGLAIQNYMGGAAQNFYSMIGYKATKRASPTLTAIGQTYFNSAGGILQPSPDALNACYFGAVSSAVGPTQTQATFTAACEL